MAFSQDLLAAGADLWEAQYEHPFVKELAAGTLDPAAFEYWLEQDYRYLLEYARTVALGAAAAREETTMRRFVDIAHTTLDVEMDLHRELAADYGVSAATLADVEKSPTCLAYTNYLVRTAAQRSLPELVAALYPCERGYLDVAEHMADRSDGDHRYTPFIEAYTGEEFREVVAWVTDLVDTYAERYPGYQDAMESAFLQSARLEYAFWESCYTRETWDV